MSHSSDPRTLYHYTSATGLRGIIESKSLWASDTRYLSDVSEFSYPRGVLARVVERMKADATFGNGRWLLDVATVLAASDSGLPLYAACVCENGNLQSQWDVYADLGTGFAVGLDRSDLYEAATQQQYSLGPVIYPVRDQESHLEQALRDAIQLVPEYQSVESPEKLTLLFALAITVTMTLIKNHRFSEEAEWRLMRQQLMEGAPSRSRGSANIPYEEVALENPVTGESSIIEIVAGPSATSESVNEVRRQLERHGFGQVAVRRSTSSSSS